METQFGVQTNQGRVRTSNEDSYAANPQTGLFLVADGMGGHVAGEVASRLAATTMDQLVMESLAGGDGSAEILLSAAQAANARVLEEQRQDRSLAGMGSTLTALMIRGDRYFIAHVGDSRAYRLRNGDLEQLTDDHSLVWHLYKSGDLEKAELSRHPQKNLITRSIGSHLQVDIDILEGAGDAGDIFLLCSDGLTDGVSDEVIQESLLAPHETPQEMADHLVELANDAGGPDNITVVIVKLARP